MKPTMVVDSLTLFSDDHSSTTLTPTTLKSITQIFESDDCLKSIQQFEQSGFVPPLTSSQQQPQQTVALKNKSNFYCGGTTTIVSPIKYEPVPTHNLKVEKDSSEESEQEEIDEDDEEYEPKAKKRMQARNGGVRRSNNSYSSSSSNNNNAKSKEPVAAEKKKRKGNMKDDYHHLPPNERERLLLRRERNKLAAARCRQRREDLTVSLMAEVKMWEGKKDELEEEIRTLRAQKEELEYILQAHSATCGLVAPKPVVAVKSEPAVVVEDELPYLETRLSPKRHRPASLTIPLSSALYLDPSGPEGVLIETPSTVIPSFDNFLTSTGLTPVVTTITTPMFGVLSNTPVSCAYQQRSKEVPDLNTPGETVSLVSL
jgi:fos-like antigen